MTIELDVINKQLAALEAECQSAQPEIDPRPWISNDHSLSMEHWKLIQRKLRLLCPGRHSGRSDITKPKVKKTLTPAHLAALQAGRLARLEAIS